MNTLRNMLFIGSVLILSQSLYAQLPTFTPMSVQSAINLGGSGKCIDIAGGNTSVGNPVVQFDCHGGSNQKFELQRANGSATKFILMSELDPSKCVGIPENVPANSGTLLRVESCHNGSGVIPASVIWTLDRNTVGTRFQSFVAASDGTRTCIDVASGLNWNSLWLQLFTCHDGNNQRWIQH